MPKEVSNNKSEKTTKKPLKQKTLKQKESKDTKKRRPNVKEEVRRYFKRIYDVTGINPTKMVKTKDGKWKLKNENIVRDLAKKKFSHLDISGVNKHIAAIFKEQFENPNKPLFERSLSPFGNSINTDVTNLINRFNKKYPFIVPRETKIAEKWNEDGTLTPGRIEYDYDDMNFDKYSGIRNNLRRYSVDMINDAFAGIDNRDLEKLRLYIIDNIHKNNPKIDPNESEENIINKYKEHVIESINKVNPSVVNPDINDYTLYLIRRFNKSEFFNEEKDIEKFKKAFIEGITNDKDPKAKGADVERFKSYIIERINNDESLKEFEKSNDYDEYIHQVYLILYSDYAKDIRREAEVLKEYLIDSVKNDEFAVDDDPVENYREESEYGIDRMVSTALNNKFKDDLHMLESYIEDKEYDDKTLDNITDKLSDILNILPWKQINGIIVDKSLRKDYHEIYPKIENYLHRGLNKFGFGFDDDKHDKISDMYDEYLDNISGISNPYENTDDKDIGNITTTNKSIDAKGGLIDKIVKEATEAFENDNQTTRGTERKNINTDMISSIIANRLDGVIDQVRNKTIRDVAAKVLERIKGKSDSHGVGELSRKASKFISPNVAKRTVFSDEFDTQYFVKPINTIVNESLADTVSKHIDIIPQILKTHEDMLDNIPNINDISDDDDYDELLLKTLSKIKKPKRKNKSSEEEQPIEPEQPIEEEHKEEEEEQEESFETSESSTIESVNEEEELSEDENIHNEMTTLNNDMVTDVTTTLAQKISQSQPQLSQPPEENPPVELSPISEPVEVDIPLEEENPLAIQQTSPSSPAIIEAQSTGTELMNQDPNDIVHITASLDAITNQLALMRYAQSATDTNNILGSIVSIFKELPNTGDDEIANKLSEAVGPDGKKLFESKEEAARFIAKMRALNGNRLSSIKGGGSGQKTGIQLNITNKVVSNMPPKPFIVDTHPIPYQY